MNKTPDFAGSGSNPNTTNNSQLILTNNNITNIATNSYNHNINNNINNRNTNLNSNSKINPLKISSNSSLEAEGLLKQSNSSANTQLQSKSTISRLYHKINADEAAIGIKNNSSIIENSYYSTSGMLVNSNPFGANLTGNASRDFGNKFNGNSNGTNINHSDGFAIHNNSSNYSSKNKENLVSPVLGKKNSDKLQIKKSVGSESQSSDTNDLESASLSDKRIEVVNYSKNKNNNYNSNSNRIKAEEEESGNNGKKKILTDKLSKLFNSNKDNNNYNANNNNANNNVNFSNSFNYNISKGTYNSLNNVNNTNNNSIVSNPNVIKSSKTIVPDSNLNNQFKGKNHVKKVAYRSLPGKTESGLTKTNQDNYVIMENILNCEEYRIYGVFDGHGNYFIMFKSN